MLAFHCVLFHLLCVCSCIRLYFVATLSSLNIFGELIHRIISKSKTFLIECVFDLYRGIKLKMGKRREKILTQSSREISIKIKNGKQFCCCFFCLPMENYVILYVTVGISARMRTHTQTYANKHRYRRAVLQQIESP